MTIPNSLNYQYFYPDNFLLNLGPNYTISLILVILLQGILYLLYSILFCYLKDLDSKFLSNLTFPILLFQKIYSFVYFYTIYFLINRYEEILKKKTILLLQINILNFLYYNLKHYQINPVLLLLVFLIQANLI